MPSIEEQLCAAAHRILTDHRRHAFEAVMWAYRLLQRCMPASQDELHDQLSPAEITHLRALR